MRIEDSVQRKLTLIFCHMSNVYSPENHFITSMLCIPCLRSHNLRCSLLFTLIPMISFCIPTPPITLRMHTHTPSINKCKLWPTLRVKATTSNPILACTKVFHAWFDSRVFVCFPLSERYRKWLNEMKEWYG